MQRSGATWSLQSQELSEDKPVTVQVLSSGSTLGKSRLCKSLSLPPAERMCAVSSPASAMCIHS